MNTETTTSIHTAEQLDKKKPYSKFPFVEYGSVNDVTESDPIILDSVAVVLGV